MPKLHQRPFMKEALAGERTPLVEGVWSVGPLRVGVIQDDSHWRSIVKSLQGEAGLQTCTRRVGLPPILQQGIQFRVRETCAPEIPTAKRLYKLIRISQPMRAYITDHQVKLACGEERAVPGRVNRLDP